MRNNGYQNYRENEVLTADPVKLIQLLYEGALDAVESARGHLRAGDILARSQAVSKGLAILHALTAALDHGRGGQLSVSLGCLYDYIERLLIEANAKQADDPLREAHALLNELLEGWRRCVPMPQHTAAEPEPQESEHQVLSYAC